MTTDKLDLVKLREAAEKATTMSSSMLHAVAHDLETWAEDMDSHDSGVLQRHAARIEKEADEVEALRKEIARLHEIPPGSGHLVGQIVDQTGQITALKTDLAAVTKLIEAQHKALREAYICRHRSPCDGCDKRIFEALALYDAWKKGDTDAE